MRNNIQITECSIRSMECNASLPPGAKLGTVLQHADFINSTLLVLGRCVYALRKGVRTIPFRDRKLTRLLSPFLTVTDCRTAMIGAGGQARICIV